MWYIPKVGDYMKILTNKEMKSFTAIKFGKYLKSTKEKLYSKLSEEENLSKFDEILSIILTTASDAVEKYIEMMHSRFSDNCIFHYDVKPLTSLDPELLLIKTKAIIKEKLKEL